MNYKHEDKLRNSPKQMPTISRFYGIVVFMNCNDHSPPYFHARYQESGSYRGDRDSIVRGVMSKRALRMPFEWSDKHQQELMRNWELAKERKPLEPIPPLA